MKTKSGNETKERKSHYYGKASRGFWKEINSIKNNRKLTEMYFLGVQLQNLEGYVLEKLRKL